MQICQLVYLLFFISYLCKCKCRDFSHGLKCSCRLALIKLFSGGGCGGGEVRFIWCNSPENNFHYGLILLPYSHTFYFFDARFDLIFLKFL